MSHDGPPSHGHRGPPGHGHPHDQPDHRGGPPGGSRRDGPPDTPFLDLEVSQVLRGEADGLVREAARDLLREAIRARLKERLGEHLEALAQLSVDTFVDDLTSNLEIERLIDERRRQRASTDERLRTIADQMRARR